MNYSPKLFIDRVNVLSEIVELQKDIRKEKSKVRNPFALAILSKAESQNTVLIKDSLDLLN